ncbi:stage II sporulation protein M [Sphingosinicella sp.]|uniref:stage II sporulation protein M n=1 Tax=Sphingosinicella sp. TaxID=1917971 RepID=UPI004037659E
MNDRPALADRPPLRADSRSFRESREGEWRRLEAILTTAEKRSVRALSDEDLLALPILYRGALSSLSVARETSLDLELVHYLEGLSARAYFFVYGVRTTAGSRLASFFARDWPVAVRSLWKETLAALLLTIIGLATGFMLVEADPRWFEGFVPSELAGGRDFSASAEYLRSTLYHDGGADGLSVFATYLFTHNSQVCIFSFALGFMFGVPTAMLIVYNGAILGAMFSLFNSHGLGFELGGWLIIHGSTEFFAIVLAGAAGLKIGWAVVFPGEETRMAAAARAGRISGVAMGGVVVMLLVAGLLEGFGRQLITDDLARYAIGGGMLAFWLLYFYVPRRQDITHDG